MKCIDLKGISLILMAVSMLFVTSCGNGIDKEVATAPIVLAVGEVLDI